ncbi:MAG: hypothetical protein NTZ93_00885 [Candidatus Beckwithbacteria bacterium]|nr:hypothetical protein [Candidatus Beckwithbacteria bacterium]
MINTETQGLRQEILKIAGQNTIQLGDKSYETRKAGLDDVPGSTGVVCEVIKFTDPEANEQMDAALITIEPNHSTPIQHWTGPRIFIESVIKGQGYWLGLSPDGETVCYEFNGEKDEPQLVTYGQGWTGSWIASESGLEVIEICVPPFEADGTILVAKPEDQVVGARHLPQEFREKYASLLPPPSPSESL